MILKDKRHTRWYEVFKITLALADDNFGDGFYINSYKVSAYLKEKKNIKISRDCVDDCLNKMIKEGYLLFCGRKQFSRKRVKKDDPNYYKTNNIYAFDCNSFGSIATEIKEYEYGEHKDFGNDIEALTTLASDYKEFCVEMNNAEKNAKKLEKANKVGTHYWYNQLNKENNAMLANDVNNGIAYDRLKVNFTDESRLRATSRLMVTPNPAKHTNENDPKHGNTDRQDFLSDYMQVDVSDEDNYEIDVKASIYRTQYNLTHDTPLDPYTDIYELFFRFSILPTTRPDIHEDVKDIWVKHTGDFVEKFEVRDAVKALCMSIYMKEGSLLWTSNTYKYFWQPRVAQGLKLSAKNQKRYAQYRAVEEIFGYEILEITTSLKKAMHYVLGTERFLKDVVFLYESDLYIYMVNKFRKAGIKCVNIYDGFYFELNTMTESEFYDVYFEALTDLKMSIEGNGDKTLKKLFEPDFGDDEEEDYDLLDIDVA